MDGEKAVKKTDWKARAKRLKTDIPAVYLALKRKDTPLKAKILAGLTVGYALSPIDLIPDVVPVLGYLDDLLILPAMAAWTVRWIPPEILEECRKEAEGLWKDGKPKKWYCALPIVGVWLVLIWLVVKAVFF